jgi:hypothetical protein
MSNGYGVDIYGQEFYGYSQPADYSVTPFTASQTNYNEISLQWSPPNTTSWKLLHLVRSTYGYPSTAQDGVLLQEITPGNMVKTYDDTALASNTIYYYAMFITIEAPTWNVGTGYLANQQVLYNGNYWTSMTSVNTGNTPVAGSTFWSPSSYIPTWYPAGYAATLSLGNSGYGSLLYNRTPQPYKITTSDTFGNASVDNPSLQNYLNVFGFGLSTLKNSYDSYLELNNPDVVSATSLDMLGQQLGINTDYMSTPQQRRQRIKNAAVNYQLKGDPQSLHNLIAELAGWDSSATYNANLLDSGDQAAFSHPIYDNWNANTTYFVNQLVQYNGYNYKNLVQSVGTAQAPTGAGTSNTWWQVQLQVLDTTTLLNPRTGLYSTWQAVPNSVAATLTGVVTGLPHPTDTTINNFNALAYNQTTNFNAGFIDFYSIAPINTPNYSNTTNYVIDNYVLNTDGYYYKALAANGPATTVVTPGTNNLVWKPFYFVTTDRPNTIKDGIPIPQVAPWDNVTQYNVGDEVQFFGIIYIATNPNTNFQPTGNYYSNLNWVYVQPSEFVYTASAYFGSIATGTSALQYAVNANFYASDGTNLTNIAIQYPTTTPYSGSVARFITDFSDLNGQGDITIPSGYWAATPATVGLWKSRYGMAFVDPTLAGTTTYEYILQPVGLSRARLALTFATDYVDTAHKAHGIIFGYVDANNFFYVTRKSLYQVSAGVESLITNWTRMVDGDRVIVDITSTDIIVSKYARDGRGNLIQLVDISNPLSGTPQFGIIHKYSASGAV